MVGHEQGAERKGKDLKRHFTVGFYGLDLSATYAEHGYRLPY